MGTRQETGIAVLAVLLALFAFLPCALTATPATQQQPLRCDLDPSHRDAEPQFALSGAQCVICGFLIDLNRATESDLEVLPGIGPALAQRIVAYRRDHGPFSSTEELSRVRGIGTKTAKRLSLLLSAKREQGKKRITDN